MELVPHVVAVLGVDELEAFQLDAGGDVWSSSAGAAEPRAVRGAQAVSPCGAQQMQLFHI